MHESTEKNQIRLSLSEVARGVGTSPQNLHKTFIKKGKLSIKRDTLGKPYVDFSEVLRVFGDKFTLHQNGSVNVVETSTEKKKVEAVIFGLNELKAENEVLRARIEQTEKEAREAKEREQESKEREVWLRGQVDKLTDTLKLIEAPKVAQEGQKSGDTDKKPPWWRTRIF